MKPPVRIQLSTRFIKSRGKLGNPIAERADKALLKFVQAPNSPGLNFEKFQNMPGYFTIRVNRNFRILLKEESDSEGVYYVVADLADHDDTYSPH